MNFDFYVKFGIMLYLFTDTLKMNSTTLLLSLVCLIGSLHTGNNELFQEIIIKGASTSTNYLKKCVETQIYLHFKINTICASFVGCTHHTFFRGSFLCIIAMYINKYIRTQFYTCILYTCFIMLRISRFWTITINYAV